MTVPGTNRIVTYTGNGVTTEFPFAFEIPDVASTVVELEVIATGVKTTLNTAQYSIAGLGQEAGGTVTYNPGTPLPATDRIIIYRKTVQTQLVSVSNQTRYFPEVVEDVWDRLAMMAQDQQEDIDRALRYPIGDSTSPELPPIVDRKSRYLTFDENGNVLMLSGITVITAFFEFRSTFAAAGLVLTNGALVAAEGYLYEYSSGATRITDISNFLPHGKWSVRHFGIVGDGDGLGGGTDDTALIESTLNSLGQGETLTFDMHPITGARYYNVTAVRMDSTATIYCEVNMDPGVRFFGIATTAQLGVLELKGIVNVTFNGLTIDSDGTAVTSVFQPNYDCALRITSQFDGVDGYTVNRPSQFLKFNGGQMRNFRRGHIHGNIETDPPQAHIAQSEITFHNHTFRGVNGCVVMNASGGYVEYTACMFTAQQFSASASWWVDADGFLIKQAGAALASTPSGSVLVNGGELQRAIAVGYGVYGQQIHIHGAVCEWAAPNYITGTVDILDPINGFFGPQTHPTFQVAAGALGRLVTRGQWEKNWEGTGGINGLFIDSSLAPEFDYTVDVNLIDYVWNDTNPMCVGGRPDIRHITVRDEQHESPRTEKTLIPRSDAWDYTVATPNGETMSAVLDATAKGGWSQTGGSGANLQFGKYTADLPEYAATAIRFINLAGGVTIGTPTGASGILVPDEYRGLAFALKVLGTSDIIRVSVAEFDHAGVTLSSSDIVLAAASTQQTAWNLTSDWQNFVVPIVKEPGARYLQVLLNGPNTGVCDIAITNFKFI